MKKNAIAVLIVLFALPIGSVIAVSQPQTESKLIDTLLHTPTTITNTNKGACPTSSLFTEFDVFTRRVTKLRPIPQEFIPSSLVVFYNPINGERDCLDATTAYNLEKMIHKAKEFGYIITLTSAYRSASTQEGLFNEYAPKYNTGNYHRVAVPGHSEHQMGTAVDIAITEYGTYYSGVNLKNSAGWKWLTENAREYGFVMSYPEGKEHLTGYHFEPWHWRYVGTENAQILNIFEHSLAFEELLSPIHYGAVAGAYTES